MRTRIVKKYSSFDKEMRFFPQWKGFFIWNYFYDSGLISARRVSAPTLKEARKLARDFSEEERKKSIPKEYFTS